MLEKLGSTDDGVKVIIVVHAADRVRYDSEIVIPPSLRRGKSLMPSSDGKSPSKGASPASQITLNALCDVSCANP